MYLHIVKSNQNNCTQQYILSTRLFDFFYNFVVETLFSCKNAFFGLPCSVQQKCA